MMIFWIFLHSEKDHNCYNIILLNSFCCTLNNDNKSQLHCFSSEQQKSTIYDYDDRFWIVVCAAAAT